jgi:hypothetical protein
MQESPRLLRHCTESRAVCAVPFIATGSGTSRAGWYHKATNGESILTSSVLTFLYRTLYILYLYIRSLWVQDIANQARGGHSGFHIVVLVCPDGYPCVHSGRVADHPQKCNDSWVKIKSGRLEDIYILNTLMSSVLRFHYDPPGFDAFVISSGSFCCLWSHYLWQRLAH